jgi:hypothetical protein
MRQRREGLVEIASQKPALAEQFVPESKSFKLETAFDQSRALLVAVVGDFALGIQLGPES